MNKRRLAMAVGIVALIALGAVAVPFVRLGLAANRAGMFTQAKPETYSASRRGNLEAIKTALELAYESDGQFPDAAKWMDTLFTRMKTDNLTEDQAKEKLRRPGAPAGSFGYAMNPAAAGKLKRELEPGTVLVFESKAGQWNAVAAPSESIPGAWGLTVEGQVVDVTTHKTPDEPKPTVTR